MRTAFQMLATACYLLCGSAGLARGDEIVDRARAMLYRDRSDSLLMLEQAVREAPRNVEYWVWLIHTLDLESGCYHFAERASREALRLNPNDPRLLQVRAAILPPSPALDVLGELEKIPGYQQRAALLKELSQFGLNLPAIWEERTASFYGTFAQQLMMAGQLGRALSIVDTGLEWTQDAERQQQHDWLTALKAMILARQGKYDESLAQQKTIAPKSWKFGRYDCLGHFLLSQGESELAVEAFGQCPPADAEQRLILACALAQCGDFAAARKVLQDQSVDWTNQLVLLDILRRAGRKDEAKQLGRKIVEPLLSYAIAYGGPLLQSRDVQMPVGIYADDYAYRPCKSSVAWLLEQFPEKSEEIHFNLGDPSQPAPSRPVPKSEPAIASSELIPRLRRAVEEATDGQRRAEARRKLAEALAEAAQYDEAAQAIAPNLRPAERGKIVPNAPPRIVYDANNWSIWKRRAVAERLHAKDPQKLASARALLQRIKWTMQSHKQEWLNEHDSIKALTAMGPEVLSSVFDELGIYTITGEDRTPLVLIIESGGGLQDAPLLIHTVGMLSSILEPGDDYPDDRAVQLASEMAIHHCLETITGVKVPKGSHMSRAKFWVQWWQTNCERIVFGKPPK